jgi:hypothetical protein
MDHILVKNNRGNRARTPSLVRTQFPRGLFHLDGKNVVEHCYMRVSGLLIFRERPPLFST